MVGGSNRWVFDLDMGMDDFVSLNQAKQHNLGSDTKIYVPLEGGHTFMLERRKGVHGLSVRWGRMGNGVRKRWEMNK